jgi:hypothetical protein
MYTQVEKPKENKNRAAANSVTQKESNAKQGIGFVDNRKHAQGEFKSMSLSGKIMQRLVSFGQGFEQNHNIADTDYTDDMAARRNYIRGQLNTIVKKSDVTQQTITTGTNQTPSNAGYTVSKLVNANSKTARLAGGNTYEIQNNNQIHLEGYGDAANPRITHLNRVLGPIGGVVNVHIDFNNPAVNIARAAAEMVREAQNTVPYDDPFAHSFDEAGSAELRTIIVAFDALDISTLVVVGMGILGDADKKTAKSDGARLIANSVAEYIKQMERLYDVTNQKQGSEIGWILTEEARKYACKEDYQTEYDNYCWADESLVNVGPVTLTGTGFSYDREISDLNKKIDALRENTLKIREVWDELPQVLEEV